MKVIISKKEIEQGVPNRCLFCPIALSLRKLLGEDKGIRVYQHRLEIDYNVYILPLKAQTFIARFDKGKSVKPFSFILKV